MPKASRPRLTDRDVTHFVVIALVGVLILSAMLAPWWTRGYTLRDEPGTTAADRDSPFFMETFSVSYAPFQTPSFGPFQFDAVREAAVTATGVALVLCALMLKASLLVGLAIRTGRVDASRSIPVRLAILSFWFGIVGVLSALLWPFLGQNIHAIYSGESIFEVPDGTVLVKASEYLNVGFFLAVPAFIGGSAYAWFHAARERALAGAPATDAAAAPA